MKKYDLVVIGGGPAGLAASLEAKKCGSNVLLIERESALGGILKQCIHDGFGLLTFGEKLSGPEYAENYIEMVKKENIPYMLNSFVSKITKENGRFILTVVSKNGLEYIDTEKLIFSTGCRERSAKQVSIHGSRPYGVLTAGACQHLVNIEGILPTKKCVILGSGDIGLIMARRLTLEGAKVIGVYEVKNEPSGLQRNIMQCLTDYDIPLHLSTTVTKVFGDERLEAIEVAKVDDKMRPIKGTEEIIECDGLILSVGLMPENELAESVGVEMDKFAKGARCDNNFETNIDNVFTCGNATHVNDLADYVSLSAEIAGNAASRKIENRKLVNINVGTNALYVVPEMLNINDLKEKVTVFYRASKTMKTPTVTIKVDDEVIFKKKYLALRPPEMEKIEVDFSSVKETSKIVLDIEE